MALECVHEFEEVEEHQTRKTPARGVIRGIWGLSPPLDCEIFIWFIDFFGLQRVLHHTPKKEKKSSPLGKFLNMPLTSAPLGIKVKLGPLEKNYF